MQLQGPARGRVARALHRKRHDGAPPCARDGSAVLEHRHLSRRDERLPHARILTFDVGSFTLPALFMAAWLLVAELFVAFHGMGYLASIVKATRARERAHTPMLAPYTSAPVAVLIASFNESEEVLEETLASASAMDYPDFQIYLLDDSTREENRAIATRVAERYGARLITRRKPGRLQGGRDQRSPAVAHRAVHRGARRGSAADSFLAARGWYPSSKPTRRWRSCRRRRYTSNHDGKPVALAAFFQQAVFYEYICEGKNASNAMFCCGSNVVLRREALLSIGTDVDGRRHYFDETSITEDFATSLRLHAKGGRPAT
jgi:cellulose synthase (UDP-forming)